MADDTIPQADNDLVKDVSDGVVRGIARMISLAEAGRPESRPALAEIYRRAGRDH